MKMSSIRQQLNINMNTNKTPTTAHTPPPPPPPPTPTTHLALAHDVGEVSCCVEPVSVVVAEGIPLQAQLRVEGDTEHMYMHVHDM